MTRGGGGGGRELEEGSRTRQRKVASGRRRRLPNRFVPSDCSSSDPLFSPFETASQLCQAGNKPGGCLDCEQTSDQQVELKVFGGDAPSTDEIFSL